MLHPHSKKYFDDKESDILLQQVLSLFRDMFGAALKDNDYLERAVVTGILRVTKASIFSGLNNLGEDSILDRRYAKHFGFTETEIKQLLCDTEINKAWSCILRERCGSGL